jgi:hypothetical protein
MVLVPEGMPAPTPLAERPKVVGTEIGSGVAQFLDQLGVFHGATCDGIDVIGDMAK